MTLIDAIFPVFDFTYMVYVPALKPVNTESVVYVVPSLLHVNGLIPELAVSLIKPFEPPLHVILLVVTVLNVGDPNS